MTRKKKRFLSPKEKIELERKIRERKEYEQTHGTQINTRFDGPLLTRVDRFIEDVENIDDRPTAIRQIVYNYMHDFYFKYGNIIMLKDVLTLMIDSINDEKMEKNTTKAAKIVTEVMKNQVHPFEELPQSELRDRLYRWNKINRFNVDKKQGMTENIRIYTVEHKMGIKFSEFQCLMTTKMIESQGNKINKKTFNEDTYSFEVQWN